MLQHTATPAVQQAAAREVPEGDETEPASPLSNRPMPQGGPQCGGYRHNGSGTVEQKKECVLCSDSSTTQEWLCTRHKARDGNRRKEERQVSNPVSRDVQQGETGKRVAGANHHP